MALDAIFAFLVELPATDENVEDPSDQPPTLNNNLSLECFFFTALSFLITSESSDIDAEPRIGKELTVVAVETETSVAFDAQKCVIDVSADVGVDVARSERR
jgi:hypothetical protein